MKNYLFICVILISCNLLAQEYIQIVRSDINIRLLPSTSEAIVGTALLGEVYEIIGQNATWYQVVLPSGQSRWIYKKLAIPTEDIPFLSTALIDNYSIQNELIQAKQQALNDSHIETISNLDMTQINNLLIDRYSLIILQKNSISPCLYKQIINLELENDFILKKDTTESLVSVTHIDYDLFKIDSENYYIETRRCFKLGTALDAIILTYHDGEDFFQKLCFEDGYGTDFENCYNIKNIYAAVLNETGLVTLTKDGKIKTTDLILRKTTLDLPHSKY